MTAMDYEEAWNALKGWIEARGGNVSGDAVLGEMEFIEDQERKARQATIREAEAAVQLVKDSSAELEFT